MDWEELVGRMLQMKILELDQERDRLVMSNRKNTMQSSKTKHAVRGCCPSASLCAPLSLPPPLAGLSS